jgi:5-methyltetrahydropteroyltriglutamate--homocysteine methyltransferase
VTDRLLTTVVGSYPQPEWLVDRKNLQSRLPPRIRAKEIWRIPEALVGHAEEQAVESPRAQACAGPRRGNL